MFPLSLLSVSGYWISTVDLVLDTATHIPFLKASVWKNSQVQNPQRRACSEGVGSLLVTCRHLDSPFLLVSVSSLQAGKRGNPGSPAGGREK